MRALVLAAALMAAVPAYAETPAPAAPTAATSLTLVDAARAPTRRVVLDGASWTCEGAVCTASGGSGQPAARACSRVVNRIGAVSQFSWKGVALTPEQIAACNA